MRWHDAGSSFLALSLHNHAARKKYAISVMRIWEKAMEYNLI